MVIHPIKATHLLNSSRARNIDLDQHPADYIDTGETDAMRHEIIAHCLTDIPILLIQC